MKLKRILITGMGLAALALCAAPQASAQGKTSPAPEAAASASPMASGAKAARGVPYRGTIASVDSAAHSFTLTTKAGASRVFMMNDQTKIMKDGAAATMADVAADQKVRGQYLKQADGTMMAKSVMLGEKGNAMHRKHKKMAEDEAASPAPTATP